VVKGRGRVDCETFDQANDFEALPARKFDEGLQQSQAFCGFARWSSKPSMQLCNKCGVFHLAPSIGNGTGISGPMSKPGPKGRYEQRQELSVSGSKRGCLDASNGTPGKLTGPNPIWLKVCQGTTGAARQTDAKYGLVPMRDKHRSRDRAGSRPQRRTVSVLWTCRVVPCPAAAPDLSHRARYLDPDHGGGLGSAVGSPFWPPCLPP
jgi:hypothetical protein